MLLYEFDELLDFEEDVVVVLTPEQVKEVHDALDEYYKTLKQNKEDTQ